MSGSRALVPFLGFLLARFPYALVFLVREDQVRVLAAAHAKRRPGYWLSRVRR